MVVSSIRALAFAGVLAAGGLAVTLSSAYRDSPLWLVWTVLAVSLCGTAGLVGAYGVAQWRELSGAAPLPPRRTIVPTVAVIGTSVLVIVAAELAAPQPWRGWRGDVLVFLTMAGASAAAAAALAVRAVARAIPDPAATDLPACENAMVAVMRLRQVLQRLCAAGGSLVVLSTLALGVSALMTKAQSREFVVVFGAAGSLGVGIFYAPAAVALRRCGERFAAVALSGERPRDVADLVDRLARRKQLEQFMGADRTMLGDLQSAIPILGPLIASAVILLPA